VQQRRKRFQKARRVVKVGIITAILTFLSSLLSAPTKIADAIEKIYRLLGKTLSQKKEENEKNVGKEFDDIDKGGRPKWD